MRKSIAAFSFLVGLASASLESAAAAETPSVNVQANAPGWVTVSYSHSGTDGVLWYQIERRGGGGTTLYSPNGQFTDTHLTPDTEYAYRVCAVYEADPACSDWSTVRTLRSPDRPANLDPPLITDIGIAPDAIRVTWGPTGDYSKILARIDDDLGNHVQLDLPNTPNGSQTFDGLRAGARYRVILKGCSFSLNGACGPWSPDMFVTTTAPLPEPPPPSKPILKVSGQTASSASLEFSVKLARSNSDDRFVVYRDTAQIQEVMPRSALNGSGGSFTDTGQPWEQQHNYHVCFEGHSPRARVCSDDVAGPPASVAVEEKPKYQVPKAPDRLEDFGVVKQPQGSGGNVFKGMNR